MYYRIIVISEEAKGHVSDKERKLVLNYKSDVELNTFSLQMLLKDFTPYNIIVVNVNKPHNRKGYYYKTTDNLNTLCEKIRKFVVTGDVEVDKVVHKDFVLPVFLPNIDSPFIKKWFVNQLGYTFFSINTNNPIYKGGINHRILCEKLNKYINEFHLSHNDEWIYTKATCNNVEIKDNMLVLTQDITTTIKEKQHKTFEY